MDQVKIQLKLVKSPLPGIKDDYTAIVVTNGTATAQDLVADAHESEPQISEIAAKQVFDTEWLYVGRMLAEGKYVNIGGIGLSPCVDGSLLHADEEVGSDRIGIQATIYDNALIQALKSMDVTTTTDPDALPFVFTKVEDVTTNTFGVITPGGAFKTLGDRQSCGLEGERIEIVDAAGVRHVIADATGDREGLWLLATAPTTLAKGKATVTVFSRGKNTPEAEPTPSPARPVTVLAAAASAPEPTAGTIDVSDVTAGLEGPQTVIRFKVTNPEGLAGYADDGEGNLQVQLKAYYTLDGTPVNSEPQVAYRSAEEDKFVIRIPIEMSAGTELKLVFSVDPEKSGAYEPETVETTVTVG